MQRRGTIDHNQYVVGNRLYQANLMSGLRVLDISDVENPVEIGFFDTVPDDAGLPAFGGAWSNYPFFESGVVVVSSWGEGLFVVRVRGRGVRLRRGASGSGAGPRRARRTMSQCWRRNHHERGRPAGPDDDCHLNVGHP